MATAHYTLQRNTVNYIYISNSTFLFLVDLKLILPKMLTGQEKIAELLIENGANVDGTNDFGKAPIHLASQRGKKYNENINN